MLRPRVFSPEQTSTKDALVIGGPTFPKESPLCRGLLGSVGSAAAHLEAPVQGGGTAIPRLMSCRSEEGDRIEGRAAPPLRWVCVCMSVWSSHPFHEAVVSTCFCLGSWEVDKW